MHTHTTMTITTYTISSTGVIDTGRPGNTPDLWAHDVIDHTPVPHPDECIDELLALGDTILNGRDSYLKAVLEFLVVHCDLPDNCCYHSEQWLEDKIGTWFDWSSDVRGSVAGWITRGSELFKERFPNWSEVRNNLGSKIDSACIARNRQKLMFDRLTVDFETYDVTGYDSATGKTILFQGFDFVRKNRYDFGRRRPLYKVC